MMQPIQHGMLRTENSMVMTWLVNSMEEDISSNYMCYHTAKELWDNINQMYSDLGNQSQVYELTLKLGEIRQVRGRIIRRQPLPSIGEVFSEVHREESRRLVMLGKRNLVNTIENSALAASINAGRTATKKPDEKSRV